jgi:hypothetical protein
MFLLAVGGNFKLDFYAGALPSPMIKIYKVYSCSLLFMLEYPFNVRRLYAYFTSPKSHWANFKQTYYIASMGERD